MDLESKLDTAQAFSASNDLFILLSNRNRHRKRATDILEPVCS